jgi:diaminopimelate decarboxylase
LAGSGIVIAERLSQRRFSVRGSELLAGGLTLTELAGRYGTPLFVYDRGILDAQLDALRTALPPEFKIYYSIKANPNLALVAHFVMRGCGIEIASAGEFEQALASGCPASRILFAGPGKTDYELETALSRGVGEIHVESFNEARRIAAICRRGNLQARVALRVNPTGDAQGGAMRMGGKPAPFGIDEEQLDPVVDYVLSQPCFDFSGIHVFAGTQVLDASTLVTQYRKGIEIARALFAKTGRPLRTVDFGGGLGIPYFAGEQELNLDGLRAGVAALMDDVRGDRAFAGTQFVVEPGRFLVGESGLYVTRIIDIKESRGKKFLILDGGMNHHLAASGNLGQTIKRNYPIVLPQRIGQPATQTVDIVGPLCTPLDTLGRNVTMPEAEVGDLVAVLQSGAYARTASPAGFLSHPTPPEAWVDDGQSWLIRSRGSAGQMMADVHIPFAVTPAAAH